MVTGMRARTKQQVGKATTWGKCKLHKNNRRIISSIAVTTALKESKTYNNSCAISNNFIRLRQTPTHDAAKVHTARRFTGRAAAGHSSATSAKFVNLSTRTLEVHWPFSRPHAPRTVTIHREKNTIKAPRPAACHRQL